MLGLILFTVFLWIMRDRIAFLDFSPFLLMLFTYEVIRSVILAVGTSGVHVADLILWEKTLCAGIIPSSVLQQAFGARAYTWLLDFVTNAFYMTHFFSVILMGIVLWLNRKAHYWAFIMGLIVLSYAAFLTYVVFPAAPPWWASMNGYLRGQPVNLNHSLLSPEYILATANPLGAMPSVHTAWPVYLFFYSLYIWGRKALPVVILPARSGPLVDLSRASLCGRCAGRDRIRRRGVRVRHAVGENLSQDPRAGQIAGDRLTPIAFGRSASLQKEQGCICLPDGFTQSGIRHPTVT